jgi:hypothetical protein
MRKAWIGFALVLIICAQITVMSLFHEVDVGGTVLGTSVIAIAKWNYVGASVQLTISPLAVNGSTGPVKVVFPNGTVRTITTSPYHASFELPRTGEALGVNGATSGPVPLSTQLPLNVNVTQNVQDVPRYISFLQSEKGLPGSMGGLEAQIYVIIVYGAAQVEVSGYGVGY